MLPQPHQPTLSWSATLLLILVAFLAIIPGISHHDRVLTRHEVLAAQPAREMLKDGKWIVPHFVGVPRYQKPAATGWLIAASTAALGENEFAVRLPSVLAGAALTLIIARMTAKILGPRAGLLAGLLQATSIYLMIQARLAEADIFVMVCAAFALSASVDAAIGRATRATAWVFYLALAVGFVFKGPIILLYPLVGLTIFAFWGGRQSLRPLLANPFAIIIALLIMVAWPVAAYLSDPGIIQGWQQETVGRMVGDLDTTAETPKLNKYLVGLTEYAVDVPWVVLPWLPLIVIGGWRARAYGWLDRPGAGRLLTAWFWGTFIVLTLAMWRQKHYIFPVLPALIPAAALALHHWARGMRRPRLFLAILFALPLVVMGWFWTQYMPKHDGYRSSAALGQVTSKLVPAGETIYLLDLGQHHIAWYTRWPMARIEGKQLDPWLKDLKTVRYAIMDEAEAEKLATAGHCEVLQTEKPMGGKRPRARVSLVKLLPRP